MVIEDQNGVRSIASEAANKPDATDAKLTQHVYGRRNRDTNDLDFSFSSSYD